MPEPVSTQYPWVRRISLYFWANWMFFRSTTVLLRQPRAGDRAQHAEVEQRFIGTLLEIGAALGHEISTATLKWSHAIRLYLYSLTYDRVIQIALALVVKNRVMPSHAQLREIIHFAELSLQYYEAASDRITGKAWTKSHQGGLRRRRISHLVSRHLTLATLHERFGVGDTSQSFERAFEHYGSAATLLEKEGSPAYAFYAIGIRSRAAHALLNYPTENRQYHARHAIDALNDAKRLLVASGIGAAGGALGNSAGSEPKNSLTGVWNQWSSSHVALTMKAYRTGAIDPALAAALVPQLLARLDWHLGIAHRQCGQIDTAIGCFGKALSELPTIIPVQVRSDLRAQIQIDKGYAHLECWKGDRVRNLKLAAQSFGSALADCTEDGLVPSERIRTYVRALIGDARAYFKLRAQQAIADDSRLPILINNLREAARLSRKMARTDLLQDFGARENLPTSACQN